MVRLLRRVQEDLLDRIDDWVDNDPSHIIARGDPYEYAAITKKSKIRLAYYVGGVVVGGIAIGETDGALHVASIVATGASGLGAWNNASKLLLYGRGVDPIQSQKAHDHLEHKNDE